MLVAVLELLLGAPPSLDSLSRSRSTCAASHELLLVATADAAAAAADDKLFAFPSPPSPCRRPPSVINWLRAENMDGARELALSPVDEVEEFTDSEEACGVH